MTEPILARASACIEIATAPEAVFDEHEGLPDDDRAGRRQRGWGTILAKLAKLFDQG